MGASREKLERLRDAYDIFTVYANREPWITIRRVLWIVTSGWWLAFDLVMLEAYSEGFTLHGERPHWTHDPLNPWCIAANVTWLVCFGWVLALGHITTALAQALTIIGIPTAVDNIRLAKFALWPYGQSIRRRPRPTTIEELHRQREERRQGQLAALLRSTDHGNEDDPLARAA